MQTHIFAHILIMGFPVSQVAFVVVVVVEAEHRLSLNMETPFRNQL